MIGIGGRRRLVAVLLLVVLGPLGALIAAAPVGADISSDPAVVAIGNGTQLANGTYLNCQTVADNLVFTSITVQATTSITIVDPCDLSTSLFGTPHFTLSLSAPTVNLNNNLNFAAAGHLNLTTSTLNLDAQVTSGGSTIDPSRV